MSKLTIKQKKFADEYIISGNATEAAIKAGYSENYAKSQSHKMLVNVGIKSYIDERFEEIQEKQIAKQEEVLKYLTSVMRGEQKEQILISEGSEYGQRITNIEVGAKDRIKAAELLGKRYRLFTDKQEITIEGPTIINGGDDLED